MGQFASQIHSRNNKPDTRDKMATQRARHSRSSCRPCSCKFKEPPLAVGSSQQPATLETTLMALLVVALILCLTWAPSSAQQQQQQQFVAQSTNYSNAPAQSAAVQAKPNYLETARQITGILDRFMSLGYDKRVRPNYGGPPVEVNVTMRILSISSVSEVMMDFTADFYFRQTWHDPRLSFKKLGDIQTLYVGAEVSKKIWLPDTFFGNEKMAYFHEATTPNVFLRIDHSGEVYRSIRLTVTSSCPMNLQYFPMDRQRCTIEAESYGYNVKDIIYRWARKDTAVERDKEISLPQFDIVQTVQKYRLEELSSGTYSRLIAEIHFARRMGYYLIQIYIPSSLIVVISWVSFWLHRNASPARVQLGVTTVLTMTTLMSSTNAALPKISYVKSIDIFLGTCFVMVFAALLEYATVGYLGKRIAMRKAHAQHAQSQAQARLFAHLQAQGAQGEPMGPVPSSNGGGGGGVVPTVGSAAAAAAAAAAGASLNIFSTTGAAASPEFPVELRHMASAQPLNSPLAAILADAQLLSIATSQQQQQQQQQHLGHHSTCAASHHAGHPHSSSCQHSSEEDQHGGRQAAHQHHHSHQHHSNSCGQQQRPDNLCQQHHQQQTHLTCSQHQCGQHNHHQQQQHHRHHHHDHHKPTHYANQDNQQCCSLANKTTTTTTTTSNTPVCGCNQRHNCNQKANELASQPQAPPRKFNNIKLAASTPSATLECPTCRPTGASQTLPRNLSYGENVDVSQPPIVYQAPCCVNQLTTAAAAPPIIQTLSPMSPSKGASAAAAQAAATFVNLHRKNKGLPPSTNPNFAQFNSIINPPYNRHLETIFGIRPSDIDKYSRVVFPVCFVCFQLMYWIVYLHISAFLEPDQQQQQQQQQQQMQMQMQLQQQNQSMTTIPPI